MMFWKKNNKIPVEKLVEIISCDGQSHLYLIYDVITKPIYVAKFLSPDGKPLILKYMNNKILGNQEIPFIRKMTPFLELFPELKEIEYLTNDEITTFEEYLKQTNQNRRKRLK